MWPFFSRTHCEEAAAEEAVAEDTPAEEPASEEVAEEEAPVRGGKQPSRVGVVVSSATVCRAACGLSRPGL